ncbi:MAG: HEPN domain-containing protein [Magnetococcales bacterium]|nr:HEPN domain-containing protein [Magnetococcales bacterium]
MSGHEQARMLLLLARKDLRVSRILAEAPEPESEAIGFHLQRATEESLKAWLIHRDEISPKVHDLSLLLSALEDAGEDVSPFLSVVALNPFAVQFRYALYEDEPFVWVEIQEQVNRLVAHVEALTALFVGEEKPCVRKQEVLE